MAVTSQHPHNAPGRVSAWQATSTVAAVLSPGLFRCCAGFLMVSRRFGLLGMRVFNILLQHGQLEPKQIADFIMREHKEARELLYKMFKAGFLQMQVSCCI